MEKKATEKHMKNQKENTPKKAAPKQIAAIVCIAILALLYVATLITAFMDGELARTLFGLCFLATVILPIVLWIYIWLYGKLTGKSTMADLNIGGRQDDSAADKN